MLSSSIKIDAPKARVWDVLSDLGGIQNWNPGVAKSFYTTDQRTGDGADRHCDLRPAGRLEERAVNWREGEGYTIDVYDSNLPIEQNLVRFSLEEHGDGTIVTISPDYKMKYGPIGKIMDVLIARRVLRRGFDGMLAGLKHYVETGEVVDDKVPQRATA